jgi:SAM-dependent methyltransferase
MSYKPIYYPETRFGGFTTVDGTVAFYARVNALIEPDSLVIDFGCGRGQYQDDPVPWRRNLRILKNKGKRVIGLDVDPAATTNPYIDEYLEIGPRGAWPIADGSVDVVVCDSVIEHLDDPNAFFGEARRVLRTGTGHLAIRTPNALSYVGIAQRLIPNRHHSRVLSRVQESRRPEDVFRTVYRCNTIHRLRQKLTEYGFDAVVYGHESEPAYLEVSRLLYFLGVLHQKLAPSVFSPTIHAFGRRI